MREGDIGLPSLYMHEGETGFAGLQMSGDVQVFQLHN